jgi:dihydroneopterin aldolase
MGESMTTVQIMYWHDIPVQVKAKHGRKRHSVELPQRFQIAVDNAAMQAGLTGSDAYIETFRWGDAEEREGTPEEVAAAVAAEVEAQFPKIDWRKTAADLKAG